jgi:3-isopropylmalate/(R)-2-methylmalate dehydratase large subunit
MTTKTMFEKIWRTHELVPETAESPAVLYVDLQLIHEVTSL